MNDGWLVIMHPGRLSCAATSIMLGKCHHVLWFVPSTMDPNADKSPLRSTFTATDPSPTTGTLSYVPLIWQVALSVDPLRPVYLSQHFRHKQWMHS